MTRTLWSKYRIWERRVEREHKLAAFAGQFGFILFAVYAISEFVIVPLFA